MISLNITVVQITFFFLKSQKPDGLKPDMVKQRLSGMITPQIDEDLGDR